MTKVAKTQHPTIALIQQRTEALARLVGPEKINQFMANVFAELRPVNAKGQPNKLLECEPGSFYAAAHQAATLKLMPGPMRECSLVPYGKTATLIIEYRGLVALAQRHPDVEKVSWDCIYEDDTFQHNKVTDEMLHVRPPDCDMSDSKLVGAWCRVLIRGSREPVVKHMTRPEIEKRAKNSPFWKDWFAEMCQKTVVRNLLNSGRIPRSTELAQAIASDIQQEQRAEILHERSEPVSHLATEVEIGFDDVPDDDQDCFGLDEPEPRPEKKKAERGEADRAKEAIVLQAVRLKWKPSQVRGFASDIFGENVKNVETLDIDQMTRLLSEMEIL